METTLVGQLLDCYRLMGRDGLMVKADKVLDTQAVDVGTVSDTLRGEVFAEVHTIGANQLGELHSGNVMLQIELRFLAISFQ